ncbi:MAG: signal recognition particle-docking protein FtsY [Gammaproteobacteria bacterium]|nr:signal recognition particle-docking protein FtsY [Gammaproteobacteria bacterium]
MGIASPASRKIVSSAAPQATATAPAGVWQRLRQGLWRTRDGLTGGLADLFLGGKQIDASILDEIETRLLLADVGVDVTRAITDSLAAALKRNELGDLPAVLRALRAQMVAVLAPVQLPLEIPAAPRPFVILVIGVNGAGKTTTIGKLAERLQRDGHRLLLAAGDTFRAAAIEQLAVWGERVGAPVIAQKTGADSAAVIFDALASARARDLDMVIADTAGRLHNKRNLMEELKKIRRTIAKFDARLPVESLLVLDGGTGQNAIAQARDFHEAIGVTGIAVTKLDGTAKGGVLLAIARQLAIPIRYIGVGEAVDDLKPFVAEDFVDALLGVEP